MVQQKAWGKESAEERASKCLQGLKKNNLNGYYFPNRNEALEHILGKIPSTATVGFGDSVTVQQIGLAAALYDRGQRLISPFWDDDPRTYVLRATSKALQAMRDALFADYFVAGINAITLDGKIVNTDGYGNRVGAIVFGPRRVILVAGVNKIVTNEEQARERIKKIAAPLNVRRHQLEYGMEIGLPCALTGECVDCDSCSICAFTVIIEREYEPRIEVVLIGEKLGL